MFSIATELDVVFGERWERRRRKGVDAVGKEGRREGRRREGGRRSKRGQQ